MSRIILCSKTRHCNTFFQPKLYFGIVKYRLILFFWALSAILICLWTLIFHRPWISVPQHLLLMVPAHALWLSATALIYRSVRWRWLLVLLTGCWILVVGIFYTIIFSSIYLIGDLVTLHILSTYMRDARAVLHSLPIAYSQCICAIVIYLATPFLICYLLSGKLARASRDLADMLWVHKIRYILLSLLLLIGFLLLRRHHDFAAKISEPFTSVCLGGTQTRANNPLFNRHRMRVGLADQRVRRAYATKSAKRPRRNVILIIVDALRADHLSAYGYARQTTPFIDELLRTKKAAKVDRCYATCSCTLCGIPSTLLSRTWSDCSPYGFNIIGLLKDRGYSTYAMLSGAHMDWYEMPRIYAADCRVYDGHESKKHYFNDDRVVLDDIADIKPYDNKPAFFYFHLLSTHKVGMLQDKYARYTPYQSGVGVKSEHNEIVINEYDNKVLQADDMIRQIFEELDHKGYLKNSIVVITADHGEGLGEHGAYGHAGVPYEQQLSIPVIICDDSLSLYRNLTMARQIDVVPTIVDRLGLPKPECWMGQSLLHYTIPEYSYHETVRLTQKISENKYMILRYDTACSSNILSDTSASDTLAPAPCPRIYKYIFTEDYKWEELYEVVSDPAEKNNLAGSEIPVLSLMRAKAHSEWPRVYGDQYK